MPAVLMVGGTSNEFSTKKAVPIGWAPPWLGNFKRSGNRGPRVLGLSLSRLDCMGAVRCRRGPSQDSGHRAADCNDSACHGWQHLYTYRSGYAIQVKSLRRALSFTGHGCCLVDRPLFTALACLHGPFYLEAPSLTHPIGPGRPLGEGTVPGMHMSMLSASGSCGREPVRWSEVVQERHPAGGMRSCHSSARGGAAACPQVLQSMF